MFASFTMIGISANARPMVPHFLSAPTATDWSIWWIFNEPIWLVVSFPI